uniref:Inhibitor I9 domain-containing protein n=1 Tax=Arundo donax TaxID=35708 RepID=A0A0A8XN12_ARUDO
MLVCGMLAITRDCFTIITFFLKKKEDCFTSTMAAEPEQQAAPAAHVHIVYVDRSKDADPEEFHLRTLTPVLGSEQKAKDAVLYHYKHAASGFSAKLTPEQVEELKKQPGVLQVVPSQAYHLHGPESGTHQGTTRTLGLM